MLRFAIRKAQTGQARLPFALYVRNDNHRPRLVKLVAMCGPLDIDDPAPAITIGPGVPCVGATAPPPHPQPSGNRTPTESLGPAHGGGPAPRSRTTQRFFR